QHGDHRVPTQLRRYVGTARLFHPRWLAIEAKRAKEGYRVAGILQIDDAHGAPGRIVGAFRVALLVHETHEGTIAVLGQPCCRTSVAVRRERTPEWICKRRTAPKSAVDWITQDLKQIHGGFRIERAEAQPMKVKARTALARQRGPVVVDG